MSGSCVLAIDQGTTGTTALVLDARGTVRARGYAELPQHFPQPGWVEHDGEEIWLGVGRAVRAALARSRVPARRIAAIGITNQRETTLLWDRASGRAAGPAIVWQDRRTAARCAALRRDGLEAEVRRRTGLVLDPYFSATKIEWMLAHRPGLRAAARRGRIAFGTIDSWLLWRLTGGAVHATDPTNASRTLLFGLRSRRWDPGCSNCSASPGRCCPRCGRRAARSARPAVWPACPTASRSPASPATSRRRCSGRAASRRASPRTPTAPVASCCCTPATARSRRVRDCSRRSRAARPARPPTRSRAACSSRVLRSSGCATDSD